MTETATESVRYFSGSGAYPDSEIMAERNAKLDPPRDATGKPLVPQDGDLYRDRSMAHELQYLIEIPGTDHKVGHVTHIYKDDEWQPLHGGNFYVAMKIPGAEHYHSAKSAAFRCLEMALYGTAAGRMMSRDAQREVIDSVMVALGIGELGDEVTPGEIDLEGTRRLQNAVRELLTWAPDGGYPEGLGAIGAENDGVGFARDGDEYQKLLDGDSDGWGEPNRRREPLPFLGADAAYYACLGYKGNGRSLKSRIRELVEAAGVTDLDI